jgi:hypothetical protein
VRTISIVRARAKIGLKNLAYKISPPGDPEPDGYGMSWSLPAAPHRVGGQTKEAALATDYARNRFSICRAAIKVRTFSSRLSRDTRSAPNG